MKGGAMRAAMCPIPDPCWGQKYDGWLTSPVAAGDLTALFDYGPFELQLT
jgi:hypothetical protein